MTILPTAMRIQDDIPLVLGRRKSPDPAAIREIREAVAKVVAVQDFECKRHELSELPVEAPAKPDADGWIPWDGDKCPIDAGSCCWQYKLAISGDLIYLAIEEACSRQYEYQWSKSATEYRITAYRLRRPI